MRSNSSWIMVKLDLPSVDRMTDEGGGKVNKFEQVSSDDHQMSVAFGGDVGPMSGILPPPTPTSPCTGRPVKTLPSLNFVCGR